MLKGKMKFTISIFLGVLSFVAFMFTAKDIAAFGALLTFFGIIAGLYNNANVKVHGLKNGGDKK